MLNLLLKVFYFPIRFILFLYNRLYYYFITEKILFIKIPSSFSYYPKKGLLRIFSEKEKYNFFEFLIFLDYVSKEEKIKTVILEIPSLENLEWNQIEDIIHCIEKIRESNKTIYGYIKEGGIKTLLVASQCNYRYTGDWSQFTVLLPFFEQFYLGDFFKKLGVEIEVFHAGKYKSAGEMYQKNKISSYAKENILELLQDRRNQIYKQLEKTPNMDKVSKNKLWNLFINQSIIHSKELKDVGFIREFVDKTQFVDFIANNDNPFIGAEIQHNVQGQGDTISKDLKEKYNKDNIHSNVITEEAFLKMVYKKNYKLFTFKKPKEIALVVMNGIIIKGEESEEAKSEIINAKGYIKLLGDLKESKEKAVLLYINSPGGMSDASELLFQEIRKLSRIKPVYVLQGSVCASGGYYISCAGNKIFSYYSTITGSIGVLRLRPVFNKFYKKYNINKSKLMFDKTTEIFSESSSLSKESRELLHKSTYRIYDVFIERVSKGRGKLIEQVKRFAEGRVYSAFRFKEAGFVDENLNFIEALEKIKEDLGIKKEEKIVLNFYPRIKFDLKELINLKNLLQENSFLDVKNVYTFLSIFQNNWFLSPVALEFFYNNKI